MRERIKQNLVPMQILVQYGERRQEAKFPQPFVLESASFVLLYGVHFGFNNHAASKKNVEILFFCL
jgi:hypothetical protein